MNQHGYIKEKEITPDQYVLGSNSMLPNFILQPDGQWDEFLIPDDTQNRGGFEPMACTTFNTLHPIEILFKCLYGFDITFSDRFTAIVSGTTPEGNSPHVVAECIRTQGLLHDSFLPFDTSITTFDGFYSPKPMNEGLVNSAAFFLNQYSFGHEWVFESEIPIQEKQELIKEALTYSPLGVSVYAWAQDQQGLYQKIGDDNHWTCLYGYVDGKYWKVFDSYTQTHKQLEWGFDFAAAKRYHIEKITTPIIKTPSFLERILGIINAIFSQNKIILES